MSKLKDKYSDAELDRSNTAFDEIVNRPDMKALDDRGDAIARDLEGAEGDTTSPRNGSSNGVKEAEKSGGKAPQNRFNYQQPDSNSKDKGRSGWSRRRKIATGVGVGGGAGGILALIFMLLPLKVPGIMSMVTSQTMQRVEQVTEKRAKTIIGRAILTKFGTHTGIVITGEGAFKTLVASMRTSGFEKRLAAKGLVIKQTPTGVKLIHNGQELENGRDFKDERAIIKALEANKLTNKLLKDIVKEDIPSWRWMKRAKFAKWLRIKYGVPRYGLTNSDNSDPEEKKKEMDTERAKRAASRTTANFRELLTCILSGSCEAVNGSNEPSTKTGDDMANEVNAAAEGSVEEVEKNGFGDRKEAAKSISKLLLGKFGTKAIPIIGWIDLLATLDHFAHEAGDNDYVGKVAAYYKGAAYAAVYAEWSGYGSQVQLGAMDPEYVGVLADELNDAEKAQAFQAVMGDSSKGVPIETMVNSDKPSNAKQLYDTIYNGPLGIGNKYVGHPIMNAYYETVGGGGFLGWVANGLGGIIGTLSGPVIDAISFLTPDAASNKVKELALETVSALGPYMLKTFGLTIDTFERGAGLLNNIFGGGVVSSNDYGKEIGFRKLSSEQVYQQNQLIAAEHAETIKENGVLYGLFSTDEPKSLTNQLAYAMPTSIEGGASSIASSVLSIPSRLASLIVPRTQADAATSYEQLYGVAPYGATTADLNQPLSQEFIDGTPCPDKPEGDYNSCTVDSEVAEAMNCEFPEAEDCSDTDDPASSGSESSGAFRIGTYNIKTSGQTDGPGDEMTPSENRTPIAAGIIKNNNFDVVGLQEPSDKQIRQFNAELPGYSYWPTIADNAPLKAGLLPVYWKTDMFTKTGGGYYGISWRDCADISMCNRAPWVKLKHNTTGMEFYVLNLHMVDENPQDASDDGARKREASSAEILRTIQSFPAGSKVFVLGDFNSSWGLTNDDGSLDGNRNRIPYCILTTATTTLANTYDLKEGKEGRCPTQERDPGVHYQIDHIYATKDTPISGYRQIINPQTRKASDHNPVYADVAIGGTGSAGGWSWPLGLQAFMSHRAAFLGSHYTGGGFLGNGSSSVDISWGDGDAGSPIYSMLDGVVKSQPLGRSSYRCTGTPNPSNNGGMTIESNVNGKVVQIAYAHGSNPNFNVGQSVKAGQQILKLGNVGNSCGSHLHMDMTYGDKNICLQDVFLALEKKQVPDLDQLANKATATCARRL